MSLADGSFGAPEGARWLAPRRAHDPLHVLQCEFWSYNNIALSSGDETCLFDPGGSPADLEATARAARVGGKRVSHVVITHSHHDHIRGWDQFPGARVWLPLASHERPEHAKQRDLDFKQVIDERLKVANPTSVFPHTDDTFAERASFTLGEYEVELRFLPGHSLCTSVAFVPALRLLISADYLVSPGLPYCRWQPRDFERAMQTLHEWCVELEVEEVWPAHNSPIDGHVEVLAAIEAESSYFVHLRQVVRELLDEGIEPAQVTRRAAQAMRARRGAPAGGRERQDGDNARRVVAEEQAGGL